MDAMIMELVILCARAHNLLTRIYNYNYIYFNYNYTSYYTLL